MQGDDTFASLYAQLKSGAEHAEVSSSRSTEETGESQRRKELDGASTLVAVYQGNEDSSCLNEVAYLKVGWKPRDRR